MINIFLFIIPKLFFILLFFILTCGLLYWFYKKTYKREDFSLSNFLFFWFIGLTVFLLAAFFAAYYDFTELSAGIIGAMGAVLTSAIFTLPQEIKKYKIISGINKKRQVYQDLLVFMEQTYSSLYQKQFGAPFLNQCKTPEEYFQVLKHNLNIIKKRRDNSLYISDSMMQLLDKSITALNNFYINNSGSTVIDAYTLEKNMQPILHELRNLIRELRIQARLETMD